MMLIVFLINSNCINKYTLMSSSNSCTYYCRKDECNGLLVNNGATTTYNWAIEHDCVVCRSRIHICELCNVNNPSYMRLGNNRFDKRRLSRHHNNKHKIVTPLSNNILRLEGAQVGIDVNTNNELATLPLDPISTSYDRIESNNYFDSLRLTKLENRDDYP